jgi:hypothetical protein
MMFLINLVESHSNTIKLHDRDLIRVLQALLTQASFFRERAILRKQVSLYLDYPIMSCLF